MNAEPERCTYCGKTRADHWMNATHHEPIIVSDVIDQVLAEQPSEMALLFRRLLVPDISSTPMKASNKTLRKRVKVHNG